MAYVPTQKEVLAGGWGFNETTGGTAGFGVNSGAFVCICQGCPAKTAGILKTVRFRLFGGANPAVVSAKVILFSGTNPYTYKGSIDVSTELNSAKIPGRFSLQIDVSASNLEVAVGDMMALFMSGTDLNVLYGSTDFTDNLIARTAYGINDPTIDAVPGVTTLDISTSVLAKKLIFDFSVLTIEDTVLTKTDITIDQTLFLPNVKDKNYYIILEDVSGIGVNEIATITLQYSYGTTASADIVQIIIDGTEGNESIGFTGKTKVPIAGVAGRIFNINLKINVSSGTLDLFYFDKNYSINQHISVTDRTPVAISGIGEVNRMILTQSEGSNANIGSVVVRFKPFLVLGDSYTAGSTPWGLNHIARVLDNAGVFTQQGYCIPAGMTGNAVLNTTNGISKRWNDTGFDLVAYTDVVLMLTGGINDTASLTIDDTEEDAKILALKIASKIISIIAEAKEVGNDVVYFSQVPYANGDNRVVEQRCQVVFNEIIRIACINMGVFYIDVYNTIPALYHDGTHPTNDGDDWISEQIVDAYENNRSPDNPNPTLEEIRVMIEGLTVTLADGSITAAKFDQSTAFASGSAHIWHVAAGTGNDSNDGHSYGTAKLTIAAALSAASDGDTIKVWSGDYAENVGGKVIELIGMNRYKTRILGSIIPESGSVVRNLTVSDSDSEGRGIVISTGVSNVQIERCNIFGAKDGIWCSGGATSDITIRDCDITSNFDGINLWGCLRMLVERCSIRTDSTHPDCDTSNAVTGIFGCNAIFNDCTFVATRTTGSASKILTGALITDAIFNNCRFDVTASGSFAGYAYGVALFRESGVVNKVSLNNCQIQRTNASGLGVDISNSILTTNPIQTNSIMKVLNTVYNESSVSGTIISGGIQGEAASAAAAVISAVQSDFSAVQKQSLNAATPAVTVSDKTGFKLASDGLNSVAPTEPAGDPGNWSFATKLIWLVYRFFGQHKKNDTAKKIEVYNPSGTKITEQTYTVSGKTETVAKAGQAT